MKYVVLEKTGTSERLYWSKAGGWGHLVDAAVFAEDSRPALPVDGVWVGHEVTEYKYMIIDSRATRNNHRYCSGCYR